ncbi:MAG: asparagine synthase (glutamine-hydrolyzing) [Desulfuromonas sp.]|nr:MAG: asparagine synthase (glutamine-hydrolyzing) [Desulfuromonas sp.]
MCGIVGFIDNGEDRDLFKNITTNMLNTIYHRGPDDSGVWIENYISLGHQRLSIVDLSSRGHQPMFSSSGRYVMVYNGEIYNHHDLRAEQLHRNRNFIGHSDTETLLSLIEDFGLEVSLGKCVGMFALALWDRKNNTLKLARDRFGEKPLYYGWHKGCFVFGSEIKALVGHPSFEKEIDRNSLSLLFRFGYIPSPYCIYKNTYKLQPGSVLSLRLANGEYIPLNPENCKQEIASYWSAADVEMRGLSDPYSGSFDEATDDLDNLLSRAVKEQMVSDVPLGAFLSGGVDSSTVVALMQKQSMAPVKTFSVGFEDSRFDEASYAREVAGHLGTDHREMIVSERDALGTIPLLPEVYDEPFADSSQVPTCLVARLARKKVKVSLSGDGADEIFCGYPRYVYGDTYANNPLHKFSRELVQRSVLFKYICSFFSSQVKAVGYFKWSLRSAMLMSSTNIEIAGHLASLCRDPRAIVRDASEPLTVFERDLPLAMEKNYIKMAMLLDKFSYLPDDILLKVDRATMSVGLESRSPYLDHRLLDFSSSLPGTYLFDGITQKKILREVLYRYVPRSIVDRPKCGFSVPLADWLRGGLSGWSKDLLQSDKYDHFLDMDKCRKIYESHCLGRGDYSLIIWTILSFLSWLNRWK